MVQDIRITTAKQDQHASKQERLRALFGPNGTTPFRASMCPKCSNFKLFDTQDHQDLAASHGHRREPSSPSSKFIDNACTHCGFFSTDRSDWPKWQGKLLTEAELQEKKSKGFYLNRDNILHHTRDLSEQQRAHIHAANLARKNQVSYQEAQAAIWEIASANVNGSYDLDAVGELLIKKRKQQQNQTQ